MEYLEFMFASLWSFLGCMAVITMVCSTLISFVKNITNMFSWQQHFYIDGIQVPKKYGKLLYEIVEETRKDKDED